MFNREIFTTNVKIGLENEVNEIESKCEITTIVLPYYNCRTASRHLWLIVHSQQSGGIRMSKTSSTDVSNQYTFMLLISFIRVKSCLGKKLYILMQIIIHETSMEKYMTENFPSRELVEQQIYERKR